MSSDDRVEIKLDSEVDFKEIFSPLIEGNSPPLIRVYEKCRLLEAKQHEISNILIKNDQELAHAIHKLDEKVSPYSGGENLPFYTPARNPKRQGQAKAQAKVEFDDDDSAKEDVAGHPGANASPNSENEPSAHNINVLQKQKYYLQPFTGEADEELLFDDWLLKLTDILVNDSITESDAKLKFLKMYLDGTARRFVEGLPSPIVNSFDEVIKALREQFQNSWRQDLMREKLEACRQRDDEGAAAFAARVRKAVRSAYLDKQPAEIEEICYQHFKNKVHNDLGLHIRLRNAKTMVEAEKAAIEMECYTQASKMRDNRNTPVTPEVTKMLHMMQTMNLDDSNRGRQYPRYPERDRSRSRDWRPRRNFDNRREYDSRQRSRSPYSRYDQSRSRSPHRSNYGYNKYRGGPSRDRSFSRERERSRERYGNNYRSRPYERTVRFRRDQTPHESINTLRESLSQAQETLKNRDEEVKSLKEAMSKLSPYTITLVTLVCAFCFIGQVEGTNPLLCNRAAQPALFSLPRQFNCPHPEYNPNAGKPQTMELFARSPLKTIIPGHFCRIYSTSVEKYTNFIGVTFYKDPKIEDLLVSKRDCESMIQSQQCQYGTLTAGKDISETHNAVDMSRPLPFFGSFTTTVTTAVNCQLYNTSLIYNRKYNTVISLMLKTDECQLTEGSCQSELGSFFMWNTSVPETCVFQSIGSYNGSYNEEGRWLTSDNQWALSFDHEPEIVVDCNTKFVLSLQDIAVTYNQYEMLQRSSQLLAQKLWFENHPNRSHLLGLGDFATETAVSMALNAMDARMNFKFRHTLSLLCHGLNSLQTFMNLASPQETTLMARKLLNTTNIEAFAINANTFGIIFCDEIPIENFNFSGVPVQTDSLPVTVDINNIQYDMFMDVHTKILRFELEHSPLFPIIEQKGQFFQLTTKGLIGGKREWQLFPAKPIELTPLINASQSIIDAILTPTHVRNTILHLNGSEDPDLTDAIREAFEYHHYEQHKAQSSDTHEVKETQTSWLWFHWPHFSIYDYFVLGSCLVALGHAFLVLFRIYLMQYLLPLNMPFNIPFNLPFNMPWNRPTPQMENGEHELGTLRVPNLRRTTRQDTEEVDNSDSSNQQPTISGTD